MNKNSLANLKKGPIKNKKPVIWNGKDYPSSVDLARELGVSDQTVYNHLHNARGCYDKPLRGSFVD